MKGRAAPGTIPSMVPAAPLHGSPEVELLRCALGPDRGAGLRERVPGLLRACGDGERLLRLSASEGCGPLLHSLLAGEPGLPGPLGEALRERNRTAAVLAVQAERLLEEAMDALAGAGVDALAFKGPVLGALLYEPSWAREYEDLDILVPPAEGDRAEAVLRSLGYGSPAEKPRALARLEDAADGTRTLVAPDGFSVDLHTRLTRADFPGRLDEDGFRRRAVKVVVAGRAMRTLHPEDLLHYLCVHACKDTWRRRVWMGDIARLLRRFPDMDGERVVAAAARAGTRRMLAVGLALAAPLLEGPLPQAALGAEASDPAALRIAGRILSDPALDPSAPAGIGEWGLLVFSMGLRERRTDRWRMLLANILVPRRTDWEALPVPGWAVPVLVPFRPLRLAWKHLFRASRTVAP